MPFAVESLTTASFRPLLTNYRLQFSGDSERPARCVTYVPDARKGSFVGSSFLPDGLTLNQALSSAEADTFFSSPLRPGKLVKNFFR